MVFEIAIQGDSEPLIIAQGDPLFYIISSLSEGDELTLDGRAISGIMINSSSTTLYGPDIINPGSLLEIRIAPNITPSIGNLQGNLSNIRIIGEGNTINLLPSAGLATISIQGDLNINATAMANSDRTMVFNLVNEVSINIPTVSNNAAIYFNLTGVTGDATIVSRDVTIYASAAVGNAGYLVGLIADGNNLIVLLSTVPGYMGIWPMFHFASPGDRIRIQPNRVVVPLTATIFHPFTLHPFALKEDN